MSLGMPKSKKFSQTINLKIITPISNKSPKYDDYPPMLDTDLQPWDQGVR